MPIFFYYYFGHNDYSLIFAKFKPPKENDLPVSPHELDSKQEPGMVLERMSPVPTAYLLLSIGYWLSPLLSFVCLVWMSIELDS